MVRDFNFKDSLSLKKYILAVKRTIIIKVKLLNVNPVVKDQYIITNILGINTIIIANSM